MKAKPKKQFDFKIGDIVSDWLENEIDFIDSQIDYEIISCISDNHPLDDLFIIVRHGIHYEVLFEIRETKCHT